MAAPRLIRNVDEFIPPHNIEAEMCALGSMLLSDKAAIELDEFLTEDSFYSPAHKEIFRAIKQLNRNSKAIDLVTLRNELTLRESLDKVGGIDYLIEIAESVPSAANAEYYGAIVQDMATLRSLEAAGQEIIKEVHNSDRTAEEKLDQAEGLVFEVGRKRLGKFFDPVRSLTKEFFKDVDTLMETGQPILGTPSGFVDLDAMTSGFYGGDLVIVAARPAMGKTSLVMNIAISVARQNVGNVAVFSLEMSGKQLVRRMVSTLASVPMGALKKANLSDHDYQKLVDASEALYDLPIFIDDTSDLTPVTMRGKCRRLKADGGLALVVVDYLQLMRSKSRTENRQQEISEIVRSLKAMAKDLDVPVIALSQLNRGVETRDDKRPNLADIRESGSIEAEADLVAFIYRKAYYDKKDNHEVTAFDPNKGEIAELLIGKHRNGPTGRVLLAFHPAYTRFSNTDQQSKDDYLASLRSRSGDE